MSVLPSNKEARLDIAIAMRAMDKLGLNESIDNHLSTMAVGESGEGEVMIVNPYGIQWSQMTVSDLVGVDLDGQIVEGKGEPHETALAIHLGIRKKRPDIISIMHTHMPYASTLGMLEDPRIKMCHQTSALFYQRVLYDNDYRGIVSDMNEGIRFGESLGDKDVILLQNHGVITTASNTSMAFDLMYYLERACMLQIKAYSTGQKVREFPDCVAQQIFREFTFEEQHKCAEKHFNSLKELIIKEAPDVLC